MDKRDMTAAFERTVYEYEKPVYNYVLSILRRREDAEDAVQETFLRLWRVFCRGTEVTAAYVFRTARSCACDIARRGRRRQTVSLADEDGYDADIPDPSPDSDPQKYFERRRKCEAVWSAIDRLPPACREIVVLRDINGLAYSEIADALRLTEGTVKSRLFRARERLAEMLKDEMP